MAKINDIRVLAEDTASYAASSPLDWMAYLDTAAKLYRYPFADNLLIHAQRPQANACAELETWNEKMGRWVNRGAKGIALIDDTGPRQRLRYVFDIEDTHMVRGGRTPYLWKMEEHDTAIQNIEGKITMKEAQSLIDSYYEERPVHLSDDERTEEADKVSSRIAEILSETAFSFSPNEYISIHRKLFQGIYKHAGKIRDYNTTKKEWVLDGATIMYGSASELKATLEYDFSQEKDFSYKRLSMDEIIHHLAVFVSRLWQIHIFGEGNTRTTAVFFIKYLRTLGFSATNDIFAENAWYFRNALVRANYTNL